MQSTQCTSLWHWEMDWDPVGGEKNDGVVAYEPITPKLYCETPIRRRVRVIAIVISEGTVVPNRKSAQPTRT